jgi:hypothetical protein
MNKVWTDEEKQYIRQNASTMKDGELSQRIKEMRGKPISVQAVRKMRQKLGIFKAKGRGKCQVVTSTVSNPTPVGSVLEVKECP